MRTTTSRLGFAVLCMTKYVRSCFLYSSWALLATVVSAFLLSATLHAQNFVYVTNRTATTNTISAFAVDAGGVLTPVANSPFSTGGVGANVLCAAVDRITISPSRNLLFATNSGDQTISVFQIAPATGILTPVAGSPFATGLTLDSCAGISLAAAPNGNFLMASANGTIKTFNVAANGALSLASTASALPSPMVGMKISGDGKLLAVSHQTSVSVLTIALDGSLTAVAGSPFPRNGTGLVGGVEFSCDAKLLYAGEGGAASSITDAWSVATTGALTPLVGSPFAATGSDSNIVFLTPDNTILLQSDQGSNDLNQFTVNPDGSLTSIGAFSIAAGHKPVGLASDNSGLFLYAADDAFGVAVFNIIPGVVPTLVADNPMTGAGQVQGVAAYPPRSCSQADFTITQTASPNPVTAGNQITYDISITNNGPSAASIAINDLLPRANMTFVSCTPLSGGAVCDKGAGLNRTITFPSLTSGASGSVRIIGSTISTLLNLDTITNTSIVSNSSAVDPHPADNTATTNVTVSAPPSATNIVATTASAVYFGNTTLTATLHRTAPGALIAGRTLAFTVDGVSVGSGITNASGVATVSLNVGTVNAGLPVGTHPIGVSFAGDLQFAPSTAPTVNLTVTKAVLTVTAQNATKVYGDANPPFTFVISGFLNNETVAVVAGTANCTTSAGVNTPASSQVITCAVGTLTATNYSFTFVSATLLITKAPLVLAGTNVTRLYGDVNPPITGTVQGLKAGDLATATFSSTASTISPVGSYPINGVLVPGGGFNIANYTLTSSGTVTVNPAPLTVAGTSVSRLYGDPNPPITGTITGQKNGDVITGVFSVAADPTSAVGTYPIIATLTDPGAKLGNYTVVNTGTLTVLPAPLSVVANNASRLYGDANPAFTGTVTGVRNGDAITASFGTTAVATSPVGTYPIVATLVDPGGKAGNYTFTPNSGTLTVTQAPLSVTANDATRIYGDANPTFTGNIVGIKNADNITATFATTATPASGVGTFPITPTLVDPGSKLGNYAVLSTNGSLTVTTAPLSVSANNATRLYGDPNPAFTGSITGIKNADNITATFASTATPASSVGTFPITVTLADPGAKLGNYTVTSTNGILTVTPAPLTVAGANATRLYGDPNPSFTGTITGIKNLDNITATFASAATATSPVGTSPIVGTLSDPTNKLPNYTVVSNNGTLTITPAPLTVAAADATRVYGDPNPPFTGSFTGLRNGDAITASFTSAATVLTNVGPALIVPVLSDPTAKLGNYSVTSTNGTLTITQAPLSVTAGNATRLYGDPNPAFTGTIVGLKNADNITANVSGAGAAPTSPAGTYPLVPALVDPNGKLGNYSTTITNGTLTVTPAPLNVSTNNATRLYGDANPAFSATITGIKNADNITATFTTTAVATSNVGTFTITVTLVDPTTKLGNYTVTSTNGTLTVSPAALSVTAANASRLYGDPNPTFAGTIVGIKNADNITATFASATTAATGVGTSPIIPTLVDPASKLTNYTVTSNNGTLTIAPAPLSVAGGTASRLYGDPNPALTGTITGIKNLDNITATFASPAVATTGVGPAPIVPTLVDPGNKLGNYAVTSVNGVLTINPAPLTVTAGNVSRLYGDPNPALPTTIIGLKNNDNITAIVGGTGADPTSPVGTFVLVPTLVDPGNKAANYTVTLNNGTLTVTPAPLAISAGNATRAYGDANPTFTGTLVGLKNGDGITATFATTATLTSPVGTFSIVPTAVDAVVPKLSNYTLTLTNGTLTVAPAALNIAAVNATRLYGDANPVFAATLTGLKNGDGITASLITSATQASPVGPFNIIPTAVDSVPSKLGNYTVTLTNGTLTVAPAPLAITANPASRLYGDANPAFTGTVTGLKNADNITATFASAATPATGVGSAAIVPTPVDPTAKIGNYSVTLNNGVLTISPAPLTVTAGNVSRLYGDPNPALPTTITGLKNNDNITAIVGGTGADPTSPVGTFVLVPTLVDPTNKAANYTITLNNGTLTISPAPLNIAANNATRLYGDANPAFSATFTGIRNNDAISATFSTAATPASAVGAFTIVPAPVDTVPGKLINYTVTLSNGTLTVAQAPLNITAANATRLYGDANPAFTGTLTGLKNGDLITASFSTTATPLSSVGSVSIVPAAHDSAPPKLGNYSVTLTNGTLSVTAAPLAITATPANRLYGDPNPVLTGTITGIKNGDAITAAFTTTAVLTTPAGPATIVASAVDPTGKLGNYNLVATNATLTINPAPLTVTAGNVSRLYGDPNPPFNGTILGLKNGDNITAVVSGAGAAPTSAVGTYVLVPSLVDSVPSTLNNYTATFTNGTLTITPAPLTISGNNATRLYGDANPAFTATFAGLKNADNITASFSSALITAAVGSYPIVLTPVDPGLKLTNYTLTTTNGTLTVSQAPLSVAATSATRIYGDANPAFTGTLTGVKPFDTITASFASVATPASSVGTYLITPALADPGTKLGNYVVTSSNGSLTVTTAPLIVVAASITRLYGDANPAFTGTITGLKNADNITATFSVTADPTSAVGSYPITPTFTDPGAKLANYTVTSSGTLTVTAAPLTVSAANASRIYGDANPAFTGTLLGLRNADNITATFTSAGPASAIGTYPIVPVLVDPSSKLGNYIVTSNNGTLTVSAAALTVTANNATRPYGSANPVLTGTIVGIKNADNITANFTTAATAASTVGTFPIVPALVDPAAKLGNYTVVSTNGTLTISKATPPVTLNIQTGVLSAQLVAIVQNAGAILPTGTVQFSEAGVNLGAPIALTSTAGAAPQASAGVSLSAGQHTITATYSGDATYTLATSTSVTVVISQPHFDLSGAGGNTSATVAAGQTANYNISLSSQGFSGVVALTCSGAPAGTTCTVNPTSATLTTASGNVPVTVTVATTLSARLKSAPGSPFKTTLFVFAGVLVGLASRARKQRKHLVLALLAFSTLGGLTACGGSPSTTPPPTVRPPTSATLTLTGTSGAQTASVNLSLTITH